jgi:hypothetical protein
MKRVLILLCLTLISGCSTLINGTDQVVIIDNYYKEKEQIRVYTPYSDYLDIMPAKLHISGGVQGGRGYSVQFTNECYSQQYFQVDRSLRGSYWLNILNVVGFFVDFGTGAMWEYPSILRMPMGRDEVCFSGLATQQID